MTDDELRRAKRGLTADYVYESDSQSALARRYGWGLVVGKTLGDIEEWPEAIERVTKEDVQQAALRQLDIRQSVSGRLIPEAGDGGEAGNKRATATESPRG